jgi:23S rRNA pseudouridine1911/1915/1917 synthase
VPDNPSPPRVLYQDEQLLIVDKPAGVAVHPSPRWREGTIIQQLRERWGDGGRALKLAHRLDRETSGVLVCTKGTEANDLMHRAFREHAVHKSYVALVEGSPAWSERVIDAPIDRHPDSRVSIRMAVVDGGAPSQTTITVLERLPDHALVRAVPRTGRTHQIRVHLAHIGHPVAGDKIYGPDEAFFLQWYEGRSSEAMWKRLGLRRQALHAERLDLPHPWRSGRLQVEAPLPRDIVERCRGLRGRVDSPMGAS